MTYARVEHIEADALEGVHPVLRRRYLGPAMPRAKCRACGFELDADELTEDLLCPECNAEVKRLEEMR